MHICTVVLYCIFSPRLSFTTVDAVFIYKTEIVMKFIPPSASFKSDTKSKVNGLYDEFWYCIIQSSYLFTISGILTPY